MKIVNYYSREARQNKIPTRTTHPGKFLQMGQGIVPLEQLSINGRIDCSFNEKYFALVKTIYIANLCESSKYIYLQLKLPNVLLQPRMQSKNIATLYQFRHLNLILI